MAIAHRLILQLIPTGTPLKAGIVGQSYLARLRSLGEDNAPLASTGPSLTAERPDLSLVTLAPGDWEAAGVGVWQANFVADAPGEWTIRGTVSGPVPAAAGATLLVDRGLPVGDAWPGWVSAADSAAQAAASAASAAAAAASQAAAEAARADTQALVTAASIGSPVIPLIGTGDFNGGLAFSRASGAAFFNGAGLALEVASNVPRWAASGLLLEGARSTISTRGRTPGGTGWANTNITVSNATGPDGVAASARTLNEGVATGQHFTVSASVAFVSGLPYPQSFIVRAGSCTTCQIFYPSAAFGGTAFQNFDLGAGVLGTGGAGIAGARILPVGGGWFWISTVAVATASASGNAGVLAMTTSASAARSPSYTGTSRTLDAFWTWTEDSAAFPSSPILAASEPATATRAREVLSGALSGLSLATPGLTIVGRATMPFTPGAGTVATLLQLDNNAAEADAIRLATAAGSNSIIGSGLTTAGGTVSTASLGSLTPGTEFAWGLSYNRLTGGAIFNVNGGTSLAIADGAAPLQSVTTQLRFGGQLAAGSGLNGTMRRVTGRPFIVGAADLAALVAAA